MPQKGQAGNGVCWVGGEDEGSKNAREGREKKDAGARAEAQRAQQLQYHRGFPGQTCSQGNNGGLNLLAVSQTRIGYQ